jgi:hypothetical protein
MARHLLQVVPVTARFLIVALAMSRMAGAQPVADRAVNDPAVDPAFGPGFVNLQRFDASSRAGVEVSLIDERSKLPFRRWELFGQYVDPTHRLGGYLRLPYTTRDRLDDNFDVIHKAVVGNLALGALWVPRLGSPHVSLVLHGGVALPVDDEDGYPVTALYGSLTRPHEMFSSLYGSTSVSGGASALIRARHVFARVDAGIEVNVRGAELTSIDRMPAIHANLGAGFEASGLSLGLELSTLTVITDQQIAYLSSPPDNFESVDVFCAMAMSVRHRTRWVQAYAALVNVLRDQQEYILDGAVVVGIEGALR